MESLTNNHPFIDGNKRTAITSSALFLQCNGYLLSASQKKMETFTLQMATGNASFHDAVAWFKKNSNKAT